MSARNQKMKIGIVGGSIAGCSAAILLLREGHDVTVFERSNDNLVGRGGGIGTTTDLMQQIKDEGMIAGDFAHFQINKMPFIGKNKSFEPFGRTAWAIPINFQVFQWNELWKHLRQNVPDQIYRKGTKIIDAKVLRNEQIDLITESGQTERFDLVLFADGYNSLGRRLLFPNAKLNYRGYILWRGLLPESDLGDTIHLNDQILRLSYRDASGHNVVYFIPDPNGSVSIGERIVNWAAYITVPNEELNELMTDKSGRIREGTLPPGMITEENELRLKAFLSDKIPDYYAEMINKTKDSYIQVIYTLDLDNYHKQNICLIGDAGMVVQPFTGSGVFKGYNNVKDLITCLKENNTLDKSLKEWGNKQLQTGKKLLALGEQMEKAFIYNQLDFSEVDELTVREWWKESVTFPENFTYEKS